MRKWRGRGEEGGEILEKSPRERKGESVGRDERKAVR